MIVRQLADANGNVTLAKSYEPYGTVLSSNGTASSIFGYAGEQLDTTGLIYLRARYMNPRLGVFLARDPWSGDVLRPGSMNGFGYAEGNPVNQVDPSGRVSEDEKLLMRMLKPSLEETASMLTDDALTNLNEGAFAAMIAAKFLVEDATVYSDQGWEGLWRRIKDVGMDALTEEKADETQASSGLEYSWGPANIPWGLADRYLKWWEENSGNRPTGCFRLDAIDTKYFDVREHPELWALSPRRQYQHELVWNIKISVQGIGLAILESSDRARKYWRSIGQPSHELSAYTIALGVLNPGRPDTDIYQLSNWTEPGFAWDWVDTAVPWVAGFLEFNLGNFLKYTDEEKARLDFLSQRPK